MTSIVMARCRRYVGVPLAQYRSDKMRSDELRLSLTFFLRANFVSNDRDVDDAVEEGLPKLAW